MFKRRKPPPKWPAKQVRDQVRVCYASDPDRLDVAAAVVVHLDPDLLPKEDDAPEYVVFCFGFSDDDRVALYMDFNVAVLVRDVVEAASLPEATAAARDWAGETATEFPFDFLPGVYRGAFWAAVRGIDPESDPSWFAWILPAGANGMHPVRDFPPPLEPTSITPTPGEVSFVLLPAHAVEALDRQLE